MIQQDKTQTTDSRETPRQTIRHRQQTATAWKTIDTTTRQIDSQTIDTTKQTNNMGTTTDRQQDNTEKPSTAANSKVDKTKQQAKLSLIKCKNDKDKISRQKAIDYYNQTGKFPS